MQITVVDIVKELIFSRKFVVKKTHSKFQEHKMNMKNSRKKRGNIKKEILLKLIKYLSQIWKKNIIFEKFNLKFLF